jgi:hypothetical protein
MKFVIVASPKLSCLAINSILKNVKNGFQKNQNDGGTRAAVADHYGSLKSRMPVDDVDH